MQKVKNISTKTFGVMAVVAVLVGVGLLYSPTAGAAVDCAVLPKAICGATDSKSLIELLKWVLKIMIALVGVAAVGGVTWAGILYVSASDNAAQVKQAKTIITDVAIGLVAFGLMFLILNWLIPGGVIG